MQILELMAHKYVIMIYLYLNLCNDFGICVYVIYMWEIYKYFSRTQMKKVMVTIFTSNSGAQKFFKDVLK